MSRVETAAGRISRDGGSEGVLERAGMAVFKAVTLVVSGVLALAAGAGHANAAELTLDSGHVDVFHVSADGGNLKLDLREDVTGQHVTHDPADVLLEVGENTRTDATADVAEIGESGYLLPQTQDPDKLWPGWDTNDVKSSGFDAVDITFEEVDGPGEVYLFQEKGFGDVASVLADGELTLESGSVIEQSEPSHVHTNWLFTEPGTYTMTVKAVADDAESNEATYTWQVSEGDGSADDSDSDSDTGTTGRDRSAAGLSDGGSDSSTTKSAGKTDSSTTKSKTDKGTTAGGSGNGSAAQQAQGANGGSNGGGNGEGGEKCTAALVPRVKDDRTSPASWKDPAGLTFGLGDAAKAQLPQEIGPVPAGDVWMIGSVQQAGVPWLGANTQHESLIQNTTGEVTWEVTDFEGPGPMTVFTQGGLGQVVGEQWFSASNGKAQGSHTIPGNTHVHPSWVFGKEGTYKVTVKQSAKTKSGETVSGSATLTFVVGGKGNADSGHFDFGAIYDAKGSCSSGGGGAAGGAGGSSGSAAASGTAGGSLADTGMSIMTVPFAILGIGVLVFGAGMIRISRKLIG
ncbi:TIGR03773 family transporter-associated surface protein [Corynebacterium sp. p3-SID1194]|uniref:TIGR03773 family transporter-associated surface protein n=1 Tax=Corynebacterium sp. p3-SID1194 TaxID=2916105 RepID=UPI0021A325B7|nr:TIGR03773 family transporter-associated surface protein [Corynebacterium sp. p3-SID1194]MCT1449579.1 TIGR03773 family transporter-associated surface protein [Corynebacterium sp. p3-SID1194]